MITVLIWKKACIVLFIKRLDIMLSEFCPDICPWADIAVALRCLRMVDRRAKSLWPISVSRDDNSLDMEKDMH
jgi:hypothetical protein